MPSTHLLQVYLESLSELQDRLPSFPNEIAWAVIEEELGVPVGQVYQQLSEQPVAAASLGQVGDCHAAAVAHGRNLMSVSWGGVASLTALYQVTLLL